MMTVEAAVHPLTPDVLEDALTLSSTAGWNQRLDDWQQLLAIAPEGSFAASADGHIVGTAIGIDYGGFGWIAMMLVDPAWRGRGVGRRLLQAAMDAIPGDRPIRLDATPMGRPLYQSFGFRDETRLSRHVAEPSDLAIDANDESHDVQAMSPADLRAISAGRPRGLWRRSQQRLRMGARRCTGVRARGSQQRRTATLLLRPARAPLRSDRTRGRRR